MDKMVLTKVFGIKPYKDAVEKKQWELELTIPEGTTERDLAMSVLRSEVIKVQNGNRNNFDKYPDGYVFKKTFAKVGYEVDPRQALIAQARAEGVDVTDKDALLEWIEGQL